MVSDHELSVEIFVRRKAGAIRTSPNGIDVGFDVESYAFPDVLLGRVDGILNLTASRGYQFVVVVTRI